MKTEDQVKAKLNQLKQIRMTVDTMQLRAQIDILEWVLSQPMGSYHVEVVSQRYADKIERDQIRSSTGNQSKGERDESVVRQS